MLVTSNFSFSHGVFKRLVSQGCQKVSLCGNGLTLYQLVHGYNESKRKPLKTLWEKEKMLKKHIFLLFQQCFIPSEKQFLFLGHNIFSSPEHKVLRVSYCDHSPSVGVRPFTFSLVTL